MVVSEIKGNKPAKTDISIFVFYINSFRNIPPLLLFKGHNQATHNIRNQGWVVSGLPGAKVRRGTEHSSDSSQM